MADTFQFNLVTPTGVLFDGPAEQVTAVGALGEFGGSGSERASLKNSGSRGDSLKSKGA
jgi:hypothetical protein